MRYGGYVRTDDFHLFWGKCGVLVLVVVWEHNVAVVGTLGQDTDVCGDVCTFGGVADVVV